MREIKSGLRLDFTSFIGQASILDGVSADDTPAACDPPSICPSTRFSLAEILVLAGIAGAGRMTPPASTRIPARLKCVRENSSPMSTLASSRSHLHAESLARGVSVIRVMMSQFSVYYYHKKLLFLHSVSRRSRIRGHFLS